VVWIVGERHVQVWVLPDKAVVVTSTVKRVSFGVEDWATLDTTVPDSIRRDWLIEGVHKERSERGNGGCSCSRDCRWVLRGESRPTEANIRRDWHSSAESEASHRTVLDPPFATNSALRRCVHGRNASQWSLKDDSDGSARLCDDSESCLTVAHLKLALDMNVAKEFGQTLHGDRTHHSE